MKKLTYLFIALFSLSLMTTSCREEKNSGEQVEEAAEEIEDEVEDSGEAVEDEIEDMDND